MPLRTAVATRQVPGAALEFLVAVFVLIDVDSETLLRRPAIQNNNRIGLNLHLRFIEVFLELVRMLFRRTL